MTETVLLGYRKVLVVNDPGSTTTSGSLHPLAITIEIGLLIWALTLFVPILLNADATRLRLKYWLWKVQHYTGVVISSETIAHTYGNVVHGYTDTGDYFQRAYLTTDHHNTVFIRRPDGQLHEVDLVNFGSRPIASNVVSVWYAVRRKKAIPMLMVNHDTGVYSWPDPKRGISQVITRHVHLIVIGFIAGILFAFLGGGAAVGLFILSFILIIVGFRFTRWSFHHWGAKQLVRISNQEAQQLREAAASQ